MYKRNQKGVTLISLAITIIILLIIAGVTVFTLINSNVTDETRWSNFAMELSSLDEAIKQKTVRNYTYSEVLGNDRAIFTEVIDSNLKDEMKNDDKYKKLTEEIVDYRDKIEGKTEQEMLVNKGNSENIIKSTGYLDGIYYVPANLASNKEHTYIYDTKSNTVFKIEPTIIGESTYHSYKGGEFILGSGAVSSGNSTIEFSEPTWLNGKASVTVTSKDKKYAIRYTSTEKYKGQEATLSLLGGTVTGLTHNEILTARTWDGTN